MHRNTRRCLQVRSLVVCWHHILTFSFVYKFIDHLQRERYHSLSVVRLFTYFWASATHLISRWGIMCLTCPSVCSCMVVPAEACHQLLVCFFCIFRQQCYYVDVYANDWPFCSSLVLMWCKMFHLFIITAACVKSIISGIPRCYTFWLQIPWFSD